MNHPGRAAEIKETKKRRKLNTFSEITNNNRLIAEVINN